jgi:ammonia channel protein AmtB
VPIYFDQRRACVFCDDFHELKRSSIAHKREEAAAIRVDVAATVVFSGIFAGLAMKFKTLVINRNKLSSFIVFFFFWTTENLRK